MEKNTCPEMAELGQLVAEAHPDLPKNYPPQHCQDYLLSLLWTLLATAMRSAVAPEGKKLSELIFPFTSFFIFSQGLTLEEIKILNKFLFGKKRELPYGTIDVDANGIVTLIKLR